MGFSALIPIYCAGKLSMQCREAAEKGRADGEILQIVFRCSLGIGDSLGTRKTDQQPFILGVGRGAGGTEQVLFS